MQEKHPYYIECILISKLNKFINTSPTIGSNFEQLQFDNVKLMAYDIGG